MFGKHTMKHWSSTQASIALSSGEAEFAGLIRGAGQGLGYQALLRDLGVGAPLRVWTDSIAAIGICTRQGLGKLRHLDTRTLWTQQAVRTNKVDLKKVLGEENPADLLTKHSISRHRLESLVTLSGCKYIGGRAESAPTVREGTSGIVTMADAPTQRCRGVRPVYWFRRRSLPYHAAPGLFQRGLGQVISKYRDAIQVRGRPSICGLPKRAPYR